MTTSQPEKLGLGELRFPDADPRLKKWSFGNLLAFTGPGMILASVTIGNGEVFSASRGGAVFGVAILWTFVFCAIMKASIVYSGARYITLTGEHPFQRWAQIIPGPRAGLPCCSACSPWSASSWAVAFIRARRGQLDLPHRHQPQIWGAFWDWSPSAPPSCVQDRRELPDRRRGPDDPVLLQALFVSNPPWGERWPDWCRTSLRYSDWVGPTTLTSPPADPAGDHRLPGRPRRRHLRLHRLRGHAGPSWGMWSRTTPSSRRSSTAWTPTRPRSLGHHAENVDNGRAWLRAVKLDILASFVSVSILAITFIMLGDVILGSGAAQEVPDDTNILNSQAQFFSVISPVLVYLYQLAIWAAFFGSLQALSTIYPYTVREAFAPSFRALRKEENFQTLKIWVNVYTFGGALFLLFTGVSYTTVISFAGVLGGVLSLGIWGFAQLWTEHKVLPAPFRMRKWMQVVVLLSSLFLTAAGLLALVQFFADLFG